MVLSALQLLLTCFVSDDEGWLNAFLSMSLLLSTPTLYLGGQLRTLYFWYLGASHPHRLVFLAFDNGIHQWPVIKRCLPWFDIKSFIHQGNTCTFQWDLKTPTSCYSSSVSWLGLCIGIPLFTMYFGDSHYLSMTILFALRHRSTVYSLCGYALIICQNYMDPQCIGQRPCFIYIEHGNACLGKTNL